MVKRKRVYNDGDYVPETKEEALALGFKYFKSHKPCPRGHNRIRLVLKSTCYDCLLDHYKKPEEKKRCRDKERKRNNIHYLTHCGFCGVPFDKIDGADRADKKRCINRCDSKDRSRRWANNNPEKVLRNRIADNSNTRRRIIYRVRHRCKSQGIPFDLVEDDIILPDKCPVLGIPLSDPDHTRNYNRPNAYSIDRIYPEKGYVKGNIRIISNRANLLKSNATVEELELVLKDLKRIRGYPDD